MLRSSGSVYHSHVRCLILNENFQFGLKVTFFKMKFIEFKYSFELDNIKMSLH